MSTTIPERRRVALPTEAELEEARKALRIATERLQRVSWPCAVYLYAGEPEEAEAFD